jgi:hypothetical protein
MAPTGFARLGPRSFHAAASPRSVTSTACMVSVGRAMERSQERPQRQYYANVFEYVPRCSLRGFI